MYNGHKRILLTLYFEITLSKVARYSLFFRRMTPTMEDRCPLDSSRNPFKSVRFTFPIIIMTLDLI